MALLGLHRQVKNNLPLRMQSRMGKSRYTSEAISWDKHLQPLVTSRQPQHDMGGEGCWTQLVLLILPNIKINLPRMG